MFRLALFASGSGTNVQNICEYFQNHNHKAEIVLSDKEDAYALERAKHLNVREHFNYISTLKFYLQKSNHKVTHIILAGYLRLIFI